MWEAPPPSQAAQNRPTGGEASARAGHRGLSQEPQQKADTPEPSSLFLAPFTKAKRAPGRKQALEERWGGGSGRCPVPRAMKQLLPQSPIAQGRCAERAGARRGRGGEEPLPVLSPDLWRKGNRVKPWGRQQPRQVPGSGERWLGRLRKAGH